MRTDKVTAGNVYDKYNTNNPIARYLVSRFLRSFEELIKHLPVKKVLEIGCGEGYLTNRMFTLFEGAEIHGVDISLEIIAQAAETYPHLHFSCQSAYSLCYKDREFDLVVACEVLEHLENPIQALLEMQRIADKYALASVPREPIWRMMNVLRGAYLRQWGNSPGHVQHWSANSFLTLVGKYFEIVETVKPWPWTMVLCRVRQK